MKLRRQPPVHSPLPLTGLLLSAVQMVRPDPRLRGAVARELAATYHARRVLLCGSGTQALQLALGMAQRAAGDDVVALPGYCCYDVASAAVGAGARIVLYDVDPDTLAPDPDSLAAAFRAGARTAVVAPLYGVPVPWQDLRALAREHGAWLVEDAAQGHGASWHGTPLGGLGALSVLSFGRGKGWTGGAGGAVLAREGAGDLPLPELPEPGRGAATLVRAAAQWLLARPALYGIPAALPQLGLGETRYHPPAPPHDVLPLSLALLARSRERARHEAAERRRRADLLLERLRSVQHLRPVHPPAGAQPGYLRLPVLLPRGIDSLAHPDAARRLGIMPGYPTTLAALPAVQERLHAPAPPLPGADQLVRQLVTLPTHSLLDDAEQRAVVAACYGVRG